MSAQWQIARGEEGSVTYRSTITPEPGQTRADIYEIVRAFVMKDATGGQPPAVLFWSLEPNQLGGDNEKSQKLLRRVDSTLYDAASELESM
jgi:hypothetical protein